ncbi:hypothetical protein DYB25_010396 [Aphanomyces astaci]|uniref:EF-hand domain-containing protein n=2 Tax=Aphanomyces astaci TaxID=112090 RepID=A0A397F3W8_APHAT|nr:hypothetical protein DYB25_010396 [Aphanomyces astaci]RHY40106.1 hypothetical protein DYB38_008022 [Aphanomyces astaci]RHY52422.1 hypothetical protein DYB30_006383 [Aphanomyces astaci]RHY54995.1 hypothetical protein DYB34_006878 [Aphanomyces astaci]RHZ09330.1 hypothetical protein DYB31_005681 [Aphanomyces astaci]
MMTGVLWTVSIDTYEHLGLVSKGKVPLNPRFLFASTGKNCVAFTMFLAALRSFHRLLQDDDPAKALRSAFLTWDTDRDGVVSEQQCRDMFTSMGWAAKLGDDATAHVLQCVVHPTTRYVRPSVSKSELNKHWGECRLVALADFCRWQEVDGNAKHNELQHRQVPPLLTTRETISILRKRYDLAHNLAKLHMAVEPSVVHDLVHTYDVDKDGALDFAEFNAFLDGPQIDDHDRSTVIERNRTFKSSAIVGTAPPIVQPGAMSNAVELLRDATEDAAAVEVAERVFQKLKSDHAYKSRIADVFREMDEDESGVLSYAEFRQGLKHKGIQLTEQEFHHLMTDVDKDKNGLVTFQELSAHLNACEKAVQLHLASVPRLTRSLSVCG